jgi:hypothetical protein
VALMLMKRLDAIPEKPIWKLICKG